MLGGALAKTRIARKAINSAGRGFKGEAGGDKCAAGGQRYGNQPNSIAEPTGRLQWLAVIETENVRHNEGSIVSRGLKIGIGLPLLLLVLAVIAGLIWRGEYPTEQTVDRSFVIEQDFTKVRKIMVRTNAAKEIVTMGGGSEFVDQKWDMNDSSIDPGIDVKEIGEGALGRGLLKSLLGEPDWELKLNGTLKVRTLDDYIGENVVTLQQAVEIVPDHIQSDTKLIEGAGRLLDYAMTTRLEREADHTRVTLKLTQEINTDAPWFAHSIADRRVRASAERTLANQEKAMRALIEENKDKSWLFPLN